MRDLEPYICTFGGCTRPTKTYGVKGDWIHHELDAHQIQKKWFCRPCEAGFSSRIAFDNHMRKEHPGLVTGHQLDLFAEMCEQSSGDVRRRTKCPLCLQEHRNEKKLHTHLADHLEQIALFAALPARSALDSEDELDLMEDSGSDGEIRAESVLLDAEDSGTQKETRNAAVRKFLGDQAEPAVREKDEMLGEDDHPKSPRISRQSTVRFPVMTIGHPAHESFYGRDQDIRELHESLSVPGDICVVHGVGGVGKTLLSVEYAYRYKEAYDCIFWLQADTAPGLAESYGEIAHTLKLVQGNEDQGRIIELSRDWMENTGRLARRSLKT